MWYREEKRCGHQGREVGNGDGNKDGGGSEDGRGREDGRGNEDRVGGGDRSGNGDESGGEGEWEREPGNLQKRERRQRVASSHSRPSRTVASRGGPESRDERRGAGPGRAEEGRRSARNPRRVINATRETGETWGGSRKKTLTRESWSSRCRPRISTE